MSGEYIHYSVRPCGMIDRANAPKWIKPVPIVKKKEVVEKKKSYSKDRLIYVWDGDIIHERISILEASEVTSISIKQLYEAAAEPIPVRCKHYLVSTTDPRIDLKHTYLTDGNRYYFGTINDFIERIGYTAPKQRLVYALKINKFYRMGKWLIRKY